MAVTFNDIRKVVSNLGSDAVVSLLAKLKLKSKSRRKSKIDEHGAIIKYGDDNDDEKEKDKFEKRYKNPEVHSD